NASGMIGPAVDEVACLIMRLGDLTRLAFRPRQELCCGRKNAADGHRQRRWEMRDPDRDRQVLADLNSNYVRAVGEADTAWFEANLDDDFVNTNPDGTLLGRAAFIEQIARGSTVKDIREHDVLIRLFGDFAIIHARTSYRRPDGSEGGGRYTDDWSF